MVPFLYILLGIALGGALSFLLLRSRWATAEALLRAEQEARLAEQQRLQDEQAARHTEQDFFRTEQERLHKELQRNAEQAEKQLKMLEEQMKSATERLLQERASDLQTKNAEQMDTLFKPLREDLERMERSMQTSRETEARNVAGIEQAIKSIVEQSQRIGQRADNLADALRYRNKTAGNWGETILAELLESQGLQEGVHFEVQQTLRDASGRALQHEETGARMVPDVILHLADNRDVVLDAKVSLAAYADYHAAETDEARAAALARHMQSIREHVRELSPKRYNDYIVPPRTAADFVIMFVPGEGALQLALQEDPTLWRTAFEKRVFIAGASTLLAALRIIDLTWVNVQQQKNTQKVMDEARKLVERVAKFYELFQKVGERLTEAQKAYTDVQDKVRDGRQSILGAGRKLEDLGVRAAKSLPREE